jgi:hypothetical protein
MCVMCLSHGRPLQVDIDPSTPLWALLTESMVVVSVKVESESVL